MPEDEARPTQQDEEHPEDEHRHRTGLRRRLGRLLNQRELAEDTREVIGGMLDISDRAKTEAVRLVAREVRNYLDELRIMDDLKDIVTSHSLEVKLSLHLKPLEEDTAEAAPEAKAAPRKETPRRAAPRKETPNPAPPRAVTEEAPTPEEPAEAPPREPTEEAPS